MFKAGDPRIEVVPEAFAIPRLAGELVSALFRKDQFDQRIEFLPGISWASFAITDPHQKFEANSSTPQW